MKKLSLLLVIFLMLLTGCGNEVGSIKSEKTSTEINSHDPTMGFVFETKNTTIALHAEIAPILQVLGESQEYFEAKSCAFPGMEKTYTYSGFELHTYELDGVDHVASVIFLDDSISTKEGISLNASLDDVLKAYGDTYTKDLDLYTFQKDKSKISFLIENNEVTSIEYVAIPE